MKRRQFLNLSVPAIGAAMVGTSLINQNAFADISRQFSTKNNFSSYDLIINGSGLAGYFAAIEAKKAGKNVLIIEKRTSPGYDIWAKGHLWIDQEGINSWKQDLTDLFLPKEELPEIENSNGKGISKSQFGDALLLFNGSVRKGLLKSLLFHKIDVLLMTDVCGIFNANNQVSGVLVASKHGTFKIDCAAFIDASDQLMFSRKIAQEDCKVKTASFVLEIANAINPEWKTIEVGTEYGLLNNKLNFNLGKRSEDQVYLSFEYKVNSSELSEIEHQARKIAAHLGKNLRKLDPSLVKASITEFAYETSIKLENVTPPKVAYKEYYVLPTMTGTLSGKSIMAIQASSQKLIRSISKTKSPLAAQTLTIVGAQIPMARIEIAKVLEPGLMIPVRSVTMNWSQEINEFKQCQVLVAGGGTAGALAAQGAVQKEANTIVVDYFNDLGGTKTMGGVMSYYHGYVKNKFFKLQSKQAERVAFETNMSKKIGRKMYHLQGIVDKGGQFITGAIICGALANQNKVEGAVICSNGVLKLLKAAITIDATGDGDLAAFAGAEFQIGNTRLGETQNYSQWDIAGKGKLPSVTNRDYDVLDNTKIAELQRGLFISHYEAHHYNFYPFLTVRESRRIVGVHLLDVIDCAENRHFEDVLSLASTDFDPHNIGSSEFSKCGFLLPHSNDITVEIPYRSIVPVKLDGLLLAGRGFSQTHNALQFTRMTADLLVLGYITGQIAADIAWKNVQPRQYNVKEIQQEWSKMGFLPEGLLDKKPGDLRNNATEIKRRVDQLALGNQEFLYECSRVPQLLIVPVLKVKFANTNDSAQKLLLAKSLAWFGETDGVNFIVEELKQLFEEETTQGYPDGYVDDYDFIRGREKNMLIGLFWRINQNIALLGMSGSNLGLTTIQHILENTVSGGGMVNRTNDYFNGRIDLKIIPFYNRILNLCFYSERQPDQKLIAGFEKLLMDTNIGNFKTTKYENVRWRVYGGSLEINIGAAMARCGGKTGLKLLVSYLEDLHSDFKSFANRELTAVTKMNHGEDVKGWEKLISKMSFPITVTPFTKDIEV